MPHSEAQAWWADVQHVRESIERRRAGAADPSAPLDASDERRFTCLISSPHGIIGYRCGSDLPYDPISSARW